MTGESSELVLVVDKVKAFLLTANLIGENHENQVIKSTRITKKWLGRIPIVQSGSVVSATGHGSSRYSGRKRFLNTNMGDTYYFQSMNLKVLKNLCLVSI